MKEYELALVLDSTLSEENQKKLIQETKDLIGKEGKVVSEKPLGRKNLAYRINKQLSGVFYVFHFLMPAQETIKLNNKLKIEDNILRYMIQEQTGA